MGLRRVAAGPLVQPVALATADEPTDRRFVVDRVGKIYVVGPDGLRSEPFLDVRDRMVELGGAMDERGLLGLAFHPAFAENRRLFVRYSAPSREGTPRNYSHTFVLSEFRATADRQHADPASERTLLTIPQPQPNHNAGDVAFGPDGYLYVPTGDGGEVGDTGLGHGPDWYAGNGGGNAQNTVDNLLGGILRIDVDGGTSETPRSGDGETADGGADSSYAVPADNPFVGSDDGLDEYYAWGFRNPWRLSFDGERLFVGDVGEYLFEEVDLVERGGNYGWNVREGTHCFDAEDKGTPPESCPDRTPADVRGGEPLLDPVVEYPHVPGPAVRGLAVVGGHVYRGGRIPAISGAYVFGDWSDTPSEPRGALFVATPPGMEAVPRDAGAGELATAERGARWDVAELSIAGSPSGRVRRYVQGLGYDGERLYVLASDGGLSGQGSVYEVVPPGEGERVSPPGTTTATTTGASREFGQRPGH